MDYADAVAVAAELVLAIDGERSEILDILMPIAPIKPPTIRDNDDLFQRDVKKAVKLSDVPGVRRLTLAPVTLGATTVKVPHQLGKIPVGWVIIDKTAQADVWRDTSIAMTGDFLPLKASGTVTVTIQVW